MKHLYTIIFLLFAVVSSLKAQTFADANDPDIIQFAFITDTHKYGPTADLRDSEANIKAFVKYCKEHPELQFALYGGDFMNAYDTNHDQAIWCLKRSQDDFADLSIPFYTTKGNHDCNGKQWKDDKPDNTQIITDKEYYDLFSPLSESNPNYAPEGIVTDVDKPYGNYYYRDFEEQQFRLIMLNNYDRDSLEYYGYHDQQLKWLAEKALDFSDKQSPSEWCFIIVGHAFSINHAKNPISRLIHAYVRGQDFFDSDNGVQYHGKFGQGGQAKLIAMMGGHFHEDIYWNWDGYNMITFSRGFATGGEVETTDRLCFDHLVINKRTMTLEDHRIGRGSDRYFTYDKPEQTYPILSFPEADGLGAYTQGGTGGEIIHVTNLNDRGKGSLRWAAEQKKCRNIVFDVAGTITLRSPLVISHDSISILGQTSPGEGISLKGAPLKIQASEVIIRYLTLYNQLEDGDFGQRNLIIDHLTTHTESGSAITILRTENVTVQNCLILGQPGNEAPALVAGGFKASYYNNRLLDCINAIKFPDLEGTNRWIHVIRNVLENWRDHAMYGGCRQGEVAAEDNYFIPGEQTVNFHILDVAEDGTGRYYVTNNVMKGFEQHNRKNARMVNDRSGIPYSPNPKDTIDRPKMSLVQKPHATQFANSCLVIAAFHNKPIFKHPSKEYIANMLKREAGSGYRPQPVCKDSLYQGDVEGYTRRLVEPERSIVVLFENDVHCNISGYPYLAGVRDLVAADSAWVAITSSGDFLQGGMIGSVSNGQAIADIMQCIDYDAITLGNHEFDFPFGVTRKLLDDIGAPVVCVNFRDIEQDTLVFAPYVIHQYGRRKVAFLGVTTPTIEETNALMLSDAEGKHLLYDLSTHDFYTRIQQAVDQARQEGADFVVVLSHLGEVNESGFSSHALIAATRGIDAVLDGHTHSFIPAATVNNLDGKPIPVAQTGSKFEHIGKLIIDPDGRIYSEMLDPFELLFRDPVTARTTEIMQEIYLPSTEALVGKSSVDMRRFNLWLTPDTVSTTINAGDLVTDALRVIGDADLAWINPGSIRTGLPAGDWTKGDIVALLPYSNYLCTIQISGRKVSSMISALLKGLTRDEVKINPFSGIRIFLKEKRKHFEVDHIEIIDRLTGRYVDLDPDKIYSIATTDYGLNLGYQIGAISRSDYVRNEKILYSDVLAKYISSQLGGMIDATSIKYKDRLIIKQ